MPYAFGDVLLVPLMFSDATDVKRRPVLVVHDAGDADLLIAPVTSHGPRTKDDVIVDEWRSAGLRLPSTARMAKLATITKSIVLRQLGGLCDSDRERSRAALRRFIEDTAVFRGND